MTYQSNSAALVAYKAQSGLGVPASGSAANVLRTTGGPGIKLAKAAIQSSEVRPDLLMSRGRHGSQKITAAYTGELSLGSHDPIIEAIMRATWDSTGLTATESDFTSITVGANTLTIASGSWIAKGFKVGDVIRASNLADAANNGRNLRVTGVSASVLTVAEDLTVNATPDTSFTITRPGKRLINSTAPIKRYFTIEENEKDIDQSTVVSDFVWGQLKLSMAPDGLLTVDCSGVGGGTIIAESTGNSPMFTSPVATTHPPLAVIDATIRFGNVDLVALTSFDLTVDISPDAPPVVGARVAPDVFTGSMSVAMNLTMLRKDLSILSDFIAETSYSLHILAVDPSSPTDFISIVVPNFTLGGADPSALSNKGGGRTQTIAIPAALVGVDTGANTEPTMIKFQTTAS